MDQQLRENAKAAANRLSDRELKWSGKAEREEAATLLERTYDAIGWHDTGLNRNRRTKQEKKKRDAIARIRSN